MRDTYRPLNRGKCLKQFFLFFFRWKNVIFKIKMNNCLSNVSCYWFLIVYFLFSIIFKLKYFRLSCVWIISFEKYCYNFYSIYQPSRFLKVFTYVRWILCILICLFVGLCLFYYSHTVQPWVFKFWQIIPHVTI